MNEYLVKSIPAPDCLAVGREQSVFVQDIEDNLHILKDKIRGSRILVIGGAGSIGSNTIDTISRFSPDAIHVVDHNENGLAELVRNLRSRVCGLQVKDFRTLPLNYGNRAFEYFLFDNAPYDYILNFAALKHVRSEKDHYSVLEMLTTNLIFMSKLMSNLRQLEPPKRFFSVSTDKAANPTSVMGASKRLMEHFLFDKSLPRPDDMQTAAARFANVAYSNGSLLQSFQNRIKLEQPLVAPINCKRYFVSLQESGQICTLAAFIAPTDTIVIPKLNPEKNLVLLENVLYGYLESLGLKAEVFGDADLARKSIKNCRVKGRWPVVLTPLNTAGEKPYEEFYSESDVLIDIGMSMLTGIEYKPSMYGNIIKIRDILEEILDNTQSSSSTKNNISIKLFHELIASVEPDFLSTHKNSAENLDQRM